MPITQHEANAVSAELERVIDENSWGLMRNYITEDQRWNLILQLLTAAEKARHEDRKRNEGKPRPITSPSKAPVP